MQLDQRYAGAACDDLHQAKAVDRCPLARHRHGRIERFDHRAAIGLVVERGKIDHDPAAHAVPPDRLSERGGRGERQRARRDIAVDIDHHHRGCGREGEQPAGKGNLAGLGLLYQLMPACFGQPVGAASDAVRDLDAFGAQPVDQTRCRAQRRFGGDGPEARGLGAAGTRFDHRLADDLGADRRALARALGHGLQHRLAAIGQLRPGAMAARAPGEQLDVDHGADSMCVIVSLDAGFDDPASRDQRCALFADAVFVKPVGHVRA